MATKRTRTSLGPDITDNIVALREAHPDWSDDRIRRAAIAAAERARGRGTPVPQGFRADVSTARGFRRA